MQVRMFSYQCSQLSTSDSILDVFRQAKTIQNINRTDKCVSVVVLDEVGLAEDSPSLPLKVLNPLLEDGTEGNSYSVDVCILMLMIYMSAISCIHNCLYQIKSIVIGCRL